MHILCNYQNLNIKNIKYKKFLVICFGHILHLCFTPVNSEYFNFKQVFDQKVKNIEQYLHHFYLTIFSIFQTISYFYPKKIDLS